MSFKVFPAEVVYEIYRFSANSALIEWRHWHKMCKAGVIDFKSITDKHALKSQGSQYSVNAQIFLSWIEGLSFAHRDIEAFQSFICHKIDRLLNEGLSFALNTINLALSVLAKADASRTMQIAVRRMISGYLFDYSIDDEPNIFHLISDTQKHLRKCSSISNVYFAHIHYYTPYDSPELALLQMKRFKPSDYVINGASRKSGIIDLAKCAFPINVTDTQLRAYLVMCRPQNDATYINDEEDSEYRLFREQKMDAILFNFIRSLYGLCGEPYNNPLSALSPFYRYVRGFEFDEYAEYEVNLHSNILMGGIYRYGVPGNASCINKCYLMVSLLLGKRRDEFLNMKYGEVTHACLNLHIIDKLVPPGPHRGTIEYKINKDQFVPTITQLVDCPLFRKYVQLYWQHNDIIIQHEFKNVAIFDHNFDLNDDINDKLLHYNEKKFAPNLFAKSLVKDKETTEYVLAHVLPSLRKPKVAKKKLQKR